MSMDTIYDYGREQIQKCDGCGAQGLMEKVSEDLQHNVELWMCECGQEEVF